jgi:hypothetical protein
MRADVPELLFPVRDSFRAWLKENAETSEGVWLIFGKTKAVVTLSANDAPEETGIAGSMRNVMLDDRLGVRFETKEMIILGGTLELEKVANNHLEKIMNLGKQIDKYLV